MRKLTYLFEFEGGNCWNYELRFDARHQFEAREDTEIRPWTRLSHHQCPNCPLRTSETEQCPIARNLNQVVEDSKSTRSYLKSRVTVTDENRTYVKNCDTQEGLRSLFGVIMASSGCPHLDWLRPLARFHLPFASVDETFFRVLSLQLLKQFFTGQAVSRESTAEIEARYAAVETVNRAFVRRVSSYCDADADNNALAALDVFVQLFPFHLKTNFESLRKYFE